MMGWPITLAHMEETPPRWVEPLRFTHGEHEIVGLAPPQQQALYCAYVMGVLRHLGIADHAPGSAEHIFYMAHALRLGLYQCGFLGDPMVGRYAFDQLLDDDFQRAGARMIGGLRPEIDLTEHVRLTATGSAKAGRPTRSIAPPALPPSSCELSIVDAEGNWVQMMNTMQSGGIPGMVVEGIPMCGSHATFTGMSGNMDAKLVAGTRMRRALGSTFVLRDGVPVLSLGTPGNVYFTIPQMLTYLLDFGLDITAAQDGVRMLPMDEDGSVTVEDRLETATLDRLASWGVNTRAVSPYEYHMGSFQMCFRDTATGQLGASADPRRCGVADGIMA
jgi:gamma-glutamyltranspeptidase/glutathione hydrolase